MTTSKPDARDALIEAVTTLLVRDGVAGISVKKVAAEAGVNHGLVHYHFGSKERLVVAAYERYRDDQWGRFSGLNPDSRASVQAAFMEEIALSSRLMVEFAALSAHMPALRQAIDSGLTAAVQLLYQRLGFSTPAEGDEFVACFFGIATHSRLRRDFDVEHALAALLRRYLGT